MLQVIRKGRGSRSNVAGQKSKKAPEALRPEGAEGNRPERKLGIKVANRDEPRRGGTVAPPLQHS
jgi:hypothetical protein